jgi:hypothetical protein
MQIEKVKEGQHLLEYEKQIKESKDTINGDRSKHVVEPNSQRANLKIDENGHLNFANEKHIARNPNSNDHLSHINDSIYVNNANSKQTLELKLLQQEYPIAVANFYAAAKEILYKENVNSQNSDYDHKVLALNKDLGTFMTDNTGLFFNSNNSNIFNISLKENERINDNLNINEGLTFSYAKTFPPPGFTFNSLNGNVNHNSGSSSSSNSSSIDNSQSSTPALNNTTNNLFYANNKQHSLIMDNKNPINTSE